MIRTIMGAAFVVCGLALTAHADEPLLPLVEEHYDVVYIVEEAAAQREWHRARAFFVRDNKVLAERSVDDEMLWGAQSGRFEMRWDDYGVCRRAVTFDSVVYSTVSERPMQPADANPWWWQGRRMTDLKAAPVSR